MNARGFAGETPLHATIGSCKDAYIAGGEDTSQCLETVRILVASGADLEAEYAGRTPLIHALKQPTEMPELIEILLEAGANSNKVTPGFSTSLMVAVL